MEYNKRSVELDSSSLALGIWDSGRLGWMFLETGLGVGLKRGWMLDSLVGQPD